MIYNLPTQKKVTGHGFLVIAGTSSKAEDKVYIPCLHVSYIGNEGSERIRSKDIIRMSLVENKFNKTYLKKFMKGQFAGSFVKYEEDLNSLDRGFKAGNSSEYKSVKVVDGGLTYFPEYDTQSSICEGNTIKWLIDVRYEPFMINTSEKEVVKNIINCKPDGFPKSIREDMKSILINEYAFTWEEEWLDDLLDLIIESKEESVFTQVFLSNYGRSDIVGSFLFKPSNWLLEKLIPMAYGISEFKKYKGRVPYIKELGNVICVKKFNPSEFKKFIEKHYRCFDLLPSRDKTQIIYLFESFGLQHAQFVKDFFKTYDLNMDMVELKGVAIARYKNPNINIDLFVKGLCNLKDYISDKEEYVLEGCLTSRGAAIIRAFFERLDEVSGDLSKLFNKPTELINKLSEVCYIVEEGAEEVAKIAVELMLSQQEYELYENLYLSVANKFMFLPRVIPELSGKVDSSYSWEFITIDNPRSMFVGLETNCCQHLNSCGSSCVEFMAHNPDKSGIFRVMKNGKTVAQSFTWLDDTSGVLCFDNIEVLDRDGIRKNIVKAYIQYIKALKPYAKRLGIINVQTGLGYNDMSETGISNLPKTFTGSLSNIGGKDVYTDAKKQAILASFDFSYKSNNDETSLEIYWRV